jgi:hypothetical protein
LSSPGGGRHHHGVSRLLFAGVEQAEIGGQAVDAEYAERRGLWPLIGIVAEPDVLAVGYGKFLPAKQAADDLALGVIGVFAFRHLGDADRTHHRPDRHRFGIVRHRADPAAHRRIDRDIQVTHQELAVGRLRASALAQLEMLGLGNPVRPAYQHNLCVCIVLHRPFSNLCAMAMSKIISGYLVAGTSSMRNSSL